MEPGQQKDVKIVFDVLVSDPLKVDLAVYSLWVQGLNGKSIRLIQALLSLFFHVIITNSMIKLF
jgi:hypothetical protein